MRILTLIAIAISLLVCSGGAWAQSSNARPESSSSVSTSTADFADDQTFAQFQRVTTGIKPPKAIHAPDPKFPDLPPDAERHGLVVMLVGVNAKGHVQAVRVLRSDEKAYEQSAVDTVKKWKFKPAEKNGQPVPVQVTVEMKFQR
ncbi:MAG: energy transducer TonB [Candidatus Korobacteraceae bacterium]